MAIECPKCQAEKIRVSFSAVVAECASLCRFFHPTIVRKYKSRLEEMSRKA